MKKLTQCSDQFSDAARTNEGLTMKSFSVLLPTLLMLIILHAASLGLWVRPYPVPKATCKSVDSCGVLWRSMSYLDDLFVFQEICILYKDSFTQYSGKVKGLLGNTWKWVLTQPNFFFLIKARILEAFGYITVVLLVLHQIAAGGEKGIFLTMWSVCHSNSNKQNHLYYDEDYYNSNNYYYCYYYYDKRRIW